MIRSFMKSLMNLATRKCGFFVYFNYTNRTAYNFSLCKVGQPLESQGLKIAKNRVCEILPVYK